MPIPITNNQQPITLTDSIFSTLAYHSIFDYPLTIEEIHRFLLINRPISSNEVTREVIKLLRHRELCHRQSVAISSGLPRRPDPGSGLLAMTGNEKFFDLRLKRHQASLPKFHLARRAALFIGFLPWIKLVCVTGSLAMENSDPDDDIDLMIVISQNRLWLARPLAILLVSLFFKRRRPSPNAQTNNPASPTGGQQPITNNNAICLNLWLDESALEIPQAQRDLYTAHELAQMKSVVNRDGTYEKMMWENRWGRKFLANAWKNFNRQISKYPNIQIDRWNLIDLLNRAVFYLQLKYMRSKMTNERVSLHAAFFHPGNRADTILKTYDRLCHRSF